MSEKITLDGLINSLTRYRERFGEKAGQHEIAVKIENEGRHLHYYVDTAFEILRNESAGAFILQAFRPEPEPEVQTFVKPIELIIREDVNTDPLNRFPNIGWKTTH